MEPRKRAGRFQEEHWDIKKTANESNILAAIVTEIEAIETEKVRGT